MTKSTKGASQLAPEEIVPSLSYHAWCHLVLPPTHVWLLPAMLPSLYLIYQIYQILVDLLHPVAAHEVSAVFCFILCYYLLAYLRLLFLFS